MVRDRLRRWEKRGEVVGLWRFEKVDRRVGTASIPYVRLKTRQQVRREQARKATLYIVPGGALAGIIFWVAWRERGPVALVLGTIVLIAVIVRGHAHWRRGCAGLHCSGCRS